MISVTSDDSDESDDMYFLICLCIYRTSVSSDDGYHFRGDTLFLNRFISTLDS